MTYLQQFNTLIDTLWQYRLTIVFIFLLLSSSLVQGQNPPLGFDLKGTLLFGGYHNGNHVFAISPTFAIETHDPSLKLRLMELEDKPVILTLRGR